MTSESGYKSIDNWNSRGTGFKRPSAGVKRMFSQIAGDYDRFNHTLSLNIDRRWRKRARKTLERYLEPAEPILDLCTGTGDLALELQKLGPVIGCDFCRPMLDIAERKASGERLLHPVDLVEGDGMRLPFGTNRFSAVSLAFGFRNMEDYDQALREIQRVIRPSGLLLILEFSLPSSFFLRRPYLFYLTRILPLAGKLLSGIIGPYCYLPASVQAFPERPEMERMLTEAGFASIRYRSLTFGISTIYLARKK